MAMSPTSRRKAAMSPSSSKKLSMNQLLLGFSMIGALVFIMQVTFVHRVILNHEGGDGAKPQDAALQQQYQQLQQLLQQQQRQQRQQEEIAGRTKQQQAELADGVQEADEETDEETKEDHVVTFEEWQKRRVAHVFAEREQGLTLEQQLGINVTLLNNIHAEPIPDVKAADGTLLYNPEEFRTGNKENYVNNPLPCPDCQQQIDAMLQRQKQDDPVPAPANLIFKAKPLGNDVIISLNPTAGNVNKRDLTWFVGSLRNTGYRGHIIMGVPEGLSEEDKSMLVSWQVTMYSLTKETCEGNAGSYMDKRGRPIHCYKSAGKFATEWGRYELARQWLNACEACTGRVLLEIDSRTSFFQSNPFSQVPQLDGKDLFLTEEMGPHSDPYYGSKQYPKRFLSVSSSNGYRTATTECYAKKAEADIGDNRPYLTARSAFGTKPGVHRYLSVLVDEFNHLITEPNCHYPKLTDDAIANFLYYNGRFGSTAVATMPFGTGYAMSVGRPCFNQYKHPNHSQLDIVKVDFETTGYIINHFKSKDDPLRVVPIVRAFDQCDRWIKSFLSQHNMGKTPSDFEVPIPYKSAVERDILRHALAQTLQKQKKKDGRPPMETSYQRSTVVTQAPWFPHKKYCTDTCCAQGVAISLDQDREHLITSVDGLDLADVGMLGHRRREYLDFSSSDLVEDIIPCLQSGTIIYTDHEGGGLMRFYDRYRPKLKKPFVLITGGTDGTEPWAPKGFGRDKLQNDELLINWYGINPSYSGGASEAKFQMMFLGLSAAFDHQKYLADFQRSVGFANPFAGENKKRFTESVELKTATDTSRLLFVKFGINEHSKHRQHPFNMACDGRTTEPFDDISCSHSKRKFQSAEIYDAARHYLFGLSPPGNGKDCYRTYELLYLGVIPIVAYNQEYAELYKGLPVLQLRSWDYSQERLVEEMRNYIASPEFQDSDFEGWNKLFLNYWRHRVLKDAGRLSEIVTDDNGREYYTSWSYTRYRPVYTKSHWPPKAPMTMSDVEPML